MSDGPKVVWINQAQVESKKEWPVNPHIVDQLEKMLAHAKDGRLQALFAVGWNTDNSILSGWQGAEAAAFALLGGVEECKMEYMLREFQRRG